VAVLILGLIVVAFFMYGSSWFVQASPKALLKVGKALGIGLLLGASILLLVTGKFLPALAALAGAAGWGLRLMTLHSFFRQVRRQFGGTQGPRQQADGGAPRQSGAMSREEALAVLGLPTDADDDEIRAAHRRLITGLHPDRGGSDFLAAQINRARDALVKK
jgi:hypothetical protein